MFERYKKEMKLDAMEKESGVIKFKYNKLTNNLTTKIYFRGKIVSKKVGKVDTETRYRAVKCARDKNVTVIGQVGNHIYGRDESDNLVTDRLPRSFLIDFLAISRIEEIVIRNKIKKNE